MWTNLNDIFINKKCHKVKISNFIGLEGEHDILIGQPNKVF